MGAISKLDSSVTTDNGCCIPSRYVTYAFANSGDRSAMGLGLARVLYPYGLLKIDGEGQFTVTMLPETIDTPYPFTQAPFTLSTPALDDVNVPLTVTANRAFMQFDSAEGLCSYWSLSRVLIAVTDDPRMLISGR